MKIPAGILVRIGFSGKNARYLEKKICINIRKRQKQKTVNIHVFTIERCLPLAWNLINVGYKIIILY